MKNRNTLFGLVAAAMLVAGIIWWSKQTPTEKPVVISAPAKPVVQVAAPAVPPKPAVVAPQLAPVGLEGQGLTLRENEVAQLMLGGHSSKAIAQRLQISVETVRVHKKHLYCKLGINSQSELFSVFLRASRA